MDFFMAPRLLPTGVLRLPYPKMFRDPQNPGAADRSEASRDRNSRWSGASRFPHQHLTLVSRKSKEMMRNKAQGVFNLLLPKASRMP
jgi:hypothetical protein